MRKLALEKGHRVRYKHPNQVRVGPHQRQERWCVALWYQCQSREHPQTTKTLCHRMDWRSPYAGEKGQNTAFPILPKPTKFRVNISRVDRCVKFHNHSDLRLGEQSGSGLISPTETYPGFPCGPVLRACGTLNRPHGKLRKV
jgi:hypothetical protein